MSDSITSDEYWAELDKQLAAVAEATVVRNKPWTEQERTLLARYYERIPSAHIAEILGRSVYSVQNAWRALRKDTP